jgi:hypothetical protein
MTTIMPEGDAIRNAVKWVSEQRTRQPDTPVAKWVEDAGFRFNLSPKEQDFLARFCKEQ